MVLGWSNCRLLVLVTNTCLLSQTLAFPSIPVDQGISHSFPLDASKSTSLERRGGCCGKLLGGQQLNNALDNSANTYGDNDLGPVNENISDPPASATHADLQNVPNIGEDDNPDDLGPPLPSFEKFGEGANQWVLRHIQESEGSAGINRLFDDALTQGQAMRQILDKYVGSKTRRIDDRSTGPPPKKIQENYVHVCNYIENFDEPDRNYEANDLTYNYERVGINWKAVKNPYSYYSCDVRSEEDSFMIMDVAFHVELKVAVVYEMMSARDRNRGANILRASELLWQMWQQVARADAGRRGVNPDAAVRSLKYIYQHNVLNQGTDNIVRLAHLASADVTNPDGSKSVKDVPDPQPGLKGKVGLDAGQGTWQQGNPLFDYFLALPNVRPTAYMIADHNTELDNNYIGVIYTFPRRLPRDPLSGLGPEYTRQFTMVIELGPPPPGLPQAGIIQTSR